MSERTFKVRSPLMEGNDVDSWRRTINRQMESWGIDYRAAVSGPYDAVLRDLTASVAYGLGVADPMHEMADGLTPEFRSKLRNKWQTPVEKIRYAARAGWRRRFKKRMDPKRRSKVAAPIRNIISSSWGYHPPVHDGVDLICPANEPIYAICDAKVIDVRSSGWWGKAPSGDVTKGDGIIQLECLTDVGPFRKGMHFAYGHAEHATVKEGDIVKAGERIGRAGLAVAWHIHFMANGGHTSKGVGDRDPMPFVRYAQKNS